MDENSEVGDGCSGPGETSVSAERLENRESWGRTHERRDCLRKGSTRREGEVSPRGHQDGL